MFFRRLAAHVRAEEAKGVRYEITLASHSMGAMVCNAALHALAHELPIRRLIYMAPACSVREGVETVRPWLRRDTPACPLQQGLPRWPSFAT